MWQTVYPKLKKGDIEMKQLNLITIACSMILFIANSVLGQTQVDVSINFTDDIMIETTFGVYTDSEGIIPIGTAIELDNCGYKISEDRRFLAGKLYVKLNEGNYGKWYLGVYTSNEVSNYDDWRNARFNLYNCSHLFLDEVNELGKPIERYIVWKYHNYVIDGIYGYSSSGYTVPDTGYPIGHEIAEIEWGGYGSFKYFVNIDPTPREVNKCGAFDDLTDNEGLTSYQSIEEMLNTLKYASIAMYEDNLLSNDPIEIAIGVDTSTTNRLGVYKTTLNFELYMR